jgi:hypothetical protein
MKHFLLALFAVFISFAIVVPDADAKRLGGGRNSGMQRDSGSFMKRDAAPQTSAKPQPGAAPQTPQKTFLDGPHRRPRRRPGPGRPGFPPGLRRGAGQFPDDGPAGHGRPLPGALVHAPQPARAPAHAIRRRRPREQQLQAPQAMPGSVSDSFAQPAAQSARLPAGFDAEAFTRQAKVNFLRMQAANDAGNLDDIREFTTPEMYAEIKLDIDERKGATQRTEVTLLDAEVLDATEEGNRYLVSVRFHGMLKEDSETAEAFDEIWHLTKPASGKGGWLVAGIQQNG